MFKSFLIPSLISLTTLVGGNNVEVSSLVVNKDLSNSYETFYGVDRSGLSFFLHYGYGFKTNQVCCCVLGPSEIILCSNFPSL